MPKPLVFPSDLQKQSGRHAYSQVEFTVLEDAKPNAINKKQFTSIYLPLPKGVNFSDTANYGEVDMGNIIGGGVGDAIGKLLQGGMDIGDALKNAAGQQLNLSSMATRATTNLLKAGAEKFGKVVGVDEGAVGVLQKKIMAPNKNTAFNGNNMRTFTFTFTLIARSKDDTDTMHNMHRVFRRYTYAGSSADNPNVVLEYPPVWKIRFIQSNGYDVFVESKYMPKIFSCYLKSFDCTFNREQSMFRTDGSPFDMTFSLNFQETRVLTRHDIDNLENISNAMEGIKNRGIDPQTGLALQAVPIDTSIPIQSTKPATAAPPIQSTNPNQPTNKPGSFGFPVI